MWEGPKQKQRKSRRNHLRVELFIRQSFVSRRGWSDITQYRVVPQVIRRRRDKYVFNKSKINFLIRRIVAEVCTHRLTHSATDV